jgi:prephenate dehydratase
MASLAPLAVYFEEQRALKNIKANKKINDWNFGTASFYVDICGSNQSQTCKDANKTLDDYKNKRGNVKILGY